MKLALALALCLSAVAFAQEENRDRLKTPPPDQNNSGKEMKQLDSVTWDVKSHKLVWVVKSGSEVDGNFVPTSTQKYEITPDNAVMSFSAEKRGFAEEEAASLQHLLDVLSLYCAESVVWWDEGMGTPLDPNDNNNKMKAPNPARPETKPSSPNIDRPGVRKVELSLPGYIRLASLPGVR